MEPTQQQILDYLTQYNGASGTMLLKQFGSLDLVNRLVDANVLEKRNWHWECGTELPDQYACYRVIKAPNSTTPNS
jgi:hypothetical protein